MKGSGFVSTISVSNFQERLYKLAGHYDSYVLVTEIGNESTASEILQRSAGS
jgi:hypothetical protein